MSQDPRVTYPAEATSDRLGVPALPLTTLALPDTYVSQSSPTEIHGYRQATWFPVVTVLDGAATKISVKIEWTQDGGVVYGPQGTESISSGIVAVTAAVWEYPAVVGGLEPIPLPVIAPGARVSIKADAGTTTQCYINIVRQA